MYKRQALGGRSLGLTTGDALLVYLAVYRYSDTYDATPAQVRQNLEKLWNEVKVLTEPDVYKRQRRTSAPAI